MNTQAEKESRCFALTPIDLLGVSSEQDEHRQSEAAPILSRPQIAERISKLPPEKQIEARKLFAKIYGIKP